MALPTANEIPALDRNQAHTVTYPRSVKSPALLLQQETCNYGLVSKKGEKTSPADPSFGTRET